MNLRIPYTNPSSTGKRVIVRDAPSWPGRRIARSWSHSYAPKIHTKSVPTKFGQYLSAGDSVAFTKGKYGVVWRPEKSLTRDPVPGSDGLHCERDRIYLETPTLGRVTRSEE